MAWNCVGSFLYDMVSRSLRLFRTRDTTLYYPNYGEEIKEWTNVFGLSQTATTTTQNNPQSGYTKTTYGSEVVGYSAAGVGHTVPVHETVDLAWFGIPLVLFPILYTTSRNLTCSTDSALLLAQQRVPLGLLQHPSPRPRLQHQLPP